MREILLLGVIVGCVTWQGMDVLMQSQPVLFAQNQNDIAIPPAWLVPLKDLGLTGIALLAMGWICRYLLEERKKQEEAHGTQIKELVAEIGKQREALLEVVRKCTGHNEA
jgi:hypothetical protein